MNAAAKAIHQSNVFEGQFTDIRFSKSALILMILLSAVLISALSVVYSTNAYRSVFNQMERVKAQNHQLQRERGQLLLEHASLSKSSRVQQMAEHQLAMRLPSVKKTIILPRK